LLVNEKRQQGKRQRGNEVTRKATRRQGNKATRKATKRRGNKKGNKAKGKVVTRKATRRRGNKATKMQQGDEQMRQQKRQQAGELDFLDASMPCCLEIKTERVACSRSVMTDFD
jgi:hypothetical protein